MEETPKPTIAQFEEDGILKPVSETAAKIALSLGKEGYDYIMKNDASCIFIRLSEVNPITRPTYNTIVEDFSRRGVEIGFNEDAQLIQVAPFRT